MIPGLPVPVDDMPPLWRSLLQFWVCPAHRSGLGVSAREHAEGALVRLSIEPANRVQIIKKLVDMLQDPQAGGQEQAAGARVFAALSAVVGRCPAVVPALALL